MNITTAAGTPAAGTLYASANLSSMWLVAELAISHSAAQINVSAFRHAYHERISKFERKFGCLDAKLDPSRPEHQHAVAYTAKSYEAYRTARRQAYNIKRRLETAVRRARSMGMAQ